MAKRITVEELETNKLRNVAREAIDKRLTRLECIKMLGKQIARAVAFDNEAGYMVIFNENKVENIH